MTARTHPPGREIETVPVCILLPLNCSDQALRMLRPSNRKGRRRRRLHIPPIPGIHGNGPG